jgi:N-acetyl-anhydromuramyl-L-alanine amidase AmpD
MRKILMSIVCILLCSTIIAQENTNIKIIEKPILYNKEREKLSVTYLKERHGINQDNATIVPKIIVLHYTAGGGINSNFNYFNGVEIEHARKLNKDQSTLNVSAHYLIDRDGTIYHLVPDTLFARHTIGLNYCSIGIENIGSKELPLTNQQVLANSNLIRYLSKKHQIEYVIGHSEYVKFRKSNLWKETNSNYITYKADPGDQFLIEVRKLIIDLNLKYQP